MGQVVLLLMDSLVGSLSTVIANATLDKVLQCLKAFRQESCSINPATYNTFLPSLKDAVTSNSQNDLWEKLKEGECCVYCSCFYKKNDKGVIILIEHYEHPINQSINSSDASLPPEASPKGGGHGRRISYSILFILTPAPRSSH